MSRSSLKKFFKDCFAVSKLVWTILLVPLFRDLTADASAYVAWLRKKPLVLVLTALFVASTAFLWQFSIFMPSHMYETSQIARRVGDLKADDAQFVSVRNAARAFDNSMNQAVSYGLGVLKSHSYQEKLDQAVLIEGKRLVGDANRDLNNVLVALKALRLHDPSLKELWQGADEDFRAFTNVLELFRQYYEGHSSESSLMSLLVLRDELIRRAEKAQEDFAYLVARFDNLMIRMDAISRAADSDVAQIRARHTTIDALLRLSTAALIYCVVYILTMIIGVIPYSRRRDRRRRRLKAKLFSGVAVSPANQSTNDETKVAES